MMGFNRRWNQWVGAWSPIRTTVTDKIPPQDIWDATYDDWWRIIPTNLCVKPNGEAVMGAGLAKQAAERYPGLSTSHGTFLREAQKNDAACLHTLPNNGSGGLILLPTKSVWWRKSSVELISGGIDWIANDWVPMMINAGAQSNTSLVVPLIGCGLGGLRPLFVVPMVLWDFNGCGCSRLVVLNNTPEYPQ